MQMNRLLKHRKLLYSHVNTVRMGYIEFHKIFKIRLRTRLFVETMSNLIVANLVIKKFRTAIQIGYIGY